VWPIEIPQFLARNVKHHPSLELGALEIKFGALPVGKPDWVGFGWMRNLILPNFKKKVAQSEFVCKSYARFTEACPGHGSRRRNMTRNRNRVKQILVVCDGKG
jgi:hypothetical protein